jgi:transposase
MVQLSAGKRQEIAELCRAGTSIRALALRFGVSRNTASRWAQEGKEQQPNFEGKPGRGRKRKSTAEQRKGIKKAALRGKSVRSIVSKPAYSNLSRTAANKILKGGRSPLAWLPVLREKQLRSPNYIKRFQFCKAANRLDYKRVVFIDAKYLYLWHDTGKYLKHSWQDPKDRVVHAEAEKGALLHFYSAVAYGHKASLVFVAPTPGHCGKGEKFAGKHFIRAMKELHKEFKEWFGGKGPVKVFLDSAPQHTSRESKKALQELGVPVDWSFPPQSWDLNLIENCWGMLVSNMRGRRPATLEGYIKVARLAWEAVDQAAIDRLVVSFPERRKACLSNQGGWPV